MMKIFLPRKFLLAFVFLASVLLPFNAALASGVPVKSYDFKTSFGGGVPRRSSIDIYITPPLDGLKKYGGSIYVKARFNDYWDGKWGELHIYGTNDDKNWVYVGSVLGRDGTGKYSRETEKTINGVPFFSKLKFTLRDGTDEDLYTTGVNVSAEVIVSVYDFVASEQSVSEARDAAIQARDNTQAAVDAARQAQQAAEEVNTIVNSTLTVNAGVVQDANGTVLSAARAAQQAAQQANSKLDNITNTLNQVQNNIQNINQYLPPTLHKISGLNGANATSSGSLQVVIDASNATQYRYKIDGGGWSPWMPLSEVVSIPVPKGVHTLTVQVANGPVGTPGPTAQESIQVIGL